ncbi:hypothetical protein [Fundidesulfovibrio butyratiphilus]
MRMASSAARTASLLDCTTAGDLSWCLSALDFLDLLDLLDLLAFFDLLEVFSRLSDFLEEDSFFEDLEDDVEEDLEALAFLEDFSLEERLLSSLVDFVLFDLLSDFELLELLSFADLPEDFVDLDELEPEDLLSVLCCPSEAFFACTRAGPTTKVVDKTSIESKRYMVRMQVLLFFLSVLESKGRQPD